MKFQICVSIFSFISCACFAMTPDQAWQKLEEGNNRFVTGKMEHPNQSIQRRKELVKGQDPFAVVVSCSDSRVVPEILFDQGLGDLFVVRVAGNVIADTELESVEYAVNHLQPSFILVIGHQNCGAVEAVFKGLGSEAPVIAKLIEPAVKAARAADSADPLQLAIRINAENSAKKLMESPSIKKKLQEGGIKVQAAFYSLETGKIELLKLS